MAVGVKVLWPLATKSLPEAIVVLPLRVTAPVPVENVPAPDWVRLLLNVAAPVTPSVPPKVVAPVPTVNVFAPVTLVAPLSETAPVPVANVPAPDCATLPEKVAFPVTPNVPAKVASPLIETAPVPVAKVPVPAMAKLPDVWSNPVIFSNAPAFVRREVLLVRREPSDRLKLATCADVEFKRLRVLVPAPVISSVVFPPVKETLLSAIVTSLNVFIPLKVCAPSKKAKVPFVPRSGRV